MTIKPTRFTLRIPDADIADLRDRLARSRFPDQAPGGAWDYGTDVTYLRQLTEYWRDKFDWRAEEAALNAFPQFRVPLDRRLGSSQCRRYLQPAQIVRHVAEFLEQLSIAEFADHGIPGAAEGDCADAARDSR